MSLQSPIAYTIPEETTRLARTILPHGNVYMRIADTLGMLFTNAEFAHLFASTGQPALDPARLAMVLIFQFMEGLTDRQAADAVRLRIDWKYALALPLDDTGFDASVLSEFRDRLRTTDSESVLLDTFLTQLHERGLLTARGTQRTDSTTVLANVRLLTRLELVGETVRATLNDLAARAPDWLRHQLHPEWRKRYEAKIDNYRLPKAKSARLELAATFGADGYALLDVIAQPTTPEHIRTAPSVVMLWRVWIQQYYGPSPTPRLRTDSDAPLPAMLIHSPYDPDARYSIKRGKAWIGYKVHLTESCDADQPRIITHVVTTPATTPDDQIVPQIHRDLAKKALLPAAHVVDCGYTSSEILVHSQRDYDVRIIGPVAQQPSWQAREKTGYDAGAFTVDWEQKHVICPQGKQSRKWHPTIDITGQAVIETRFAQTDCAVCPVRAQCTHSPRGPRSVTVRTQPYHEALHAARQHQRTPEFHQEYAIRSGIESSIAQGVRVAELRRTRYMGLEKTHLQHLLSALALNVIRVGAWLAEPHRQVRPRSALARLVASG